MKKLFNVIGRSKNYIVLLLILLLTYALYRLVGWTSRNFADLTMDQIIFHILVPLDGAETDLLRSAVKDVLEPSLIFIAAISMILLIQSRIGFTTYLNIHLKKRDRFYKIPIWSRLILVRIIRFMAFTLLILSLNEANRSFAFNDYIADQLNSSNIIERNHVDPHGLLTFPEEKRNLIYIYLESMEVTYASEEYGGAFEDNYIPELIELAEEHTNFSSTEGFGGYTYATGTSWTMAAMFSHSTGLPLKLPVQGNNLSEYGEFFTGAISIGDILKEHGYSNNLLIGSDATFGGRRNFYTQHGDYEIYDYPRAKEDGLIPEDYKVWWGYEDEKLFAFAKDLLGELKNNEEPFNLTLLTADTHHEDGYLRDSAELRFEEQYANVIADSSRQVSEFIHWIKEQDFYENTTIVVVGDHETMDVDFLDDIDEDYHRTMYNAFINAPKITDTAVTKNRGFTAFDLYPTTLSSIGVQIEGNRLGLGVDLFSGEETLLEKYGESMNLELAKKSGFYTSRFIGGKNLSPYRQED